MDRERFQRVEALFLAASNLPADKREDFLAAECGDDASLRDEVSAMLVADEEGALGESSGIRDQLQSVLDGAGTGVGIPERIGPYRVVRRVALGGMGAVYEAEQSHPQRRVALKVVRPDALSREMLGRFRHETEILGRLQHPGIAQIFQAGTFDLGDGEQPFFAMEFVDGRQILDFVRENDLSIRERLALVADVCDAVHHAHQQGVIHRDLKSDNVLVSADGKPKILDFGVGRLTDADSHAATALTIAGQIVGTLAYMSPEQARGPSADVDTRSDVYALGVILYEVLAERLPFDLKGLSITEVWRTICEDDPPRLSEKTGESFGDVEAIVGMAMEKDKSRRYASANGLAADIRRYLADLPISARKATTWYQIRKFARRHRVAVTGAVATALALTIGIVTTTVQAVRATRLASIAGQSEQEAQRMAYRASIAAASSALALGEGLAARRYLDDAPAELRQWEWRHLNARLDATEAVFPGEAGPGTAAFGSDGTPLYVGLRGGNPGVFDVITGELVTKLDLETEPAAFAISSDGTMVAAIDSALRMRIWEGGALRIEMPIELEGPLVGLRLSRDASLAVALSEQEVRFIDLRTGRERARHRVAPSTRILGGELTADGSTLVLPVWKPLLQLVDTRTGEIIAEKPLPNGSDILAVHPDGGRIASGTDQFTHVTRILEGSTLAEIGQVGGHPDRPWCAAFSPDGRYLATCSPGRIVVHDASTLAKLKSLLSPGTSPNAVHWSPDGSQLLVTDDTGEARLVRWGTPPFLELVGHESFVYVAAWSRDGTLVASGAWDRTIRLWDALTGEPLAVFPFDAPYPSYIGMSPDGARVLATIGKGLDAWDTATGERVPVPPSVRHPALPGAPGPWSAGGSKFVPMSTGQSSATSPDGSLLLQQNRVIDMASGADRIALPLQPGKILAVAASHDSRLVATGSRDGAIRIWEIATGEPLANLTGPAETGTRSGPHAAEVFSVEFSPDGKRLISGGDNARVLLWDFESGQEVAALQPHESYVHVVAFSPDGTRILSGSGDATLRIWDSRPWIERSREIRRARALRAEMRPRVQRLLDELHDPARVATRLRADASLDAAHRRAALRVLLALSNAPR